MKKLIFALMVAFTIMISGVFGYIQRVYPTEAEKGTHEFLVTLYNPTQYSEKDAQLSVYFPYLEIKGRSGAFALKAEKTGRAYIEVDFSESIEPGFYPVILTFQNEDVRERKHTWIYID